MTSELETFFSDLGLRLDNFAFGDIVYPKAFRDVIVDTEQEKILITQVENEKIKKSNEMDGKITRAVRINPLIHY